MSAPTEDYAVEQVELENSESTNSAVEVAQVSPVSVPEKQIDREEHYDKQRGKVERFGQASNLATCVSALFVAAGVMFAAASYNTERNARKERFTFEYAEKVYQKELHATRVRLLDRIKSFDALHASFSSRPTAKSTHFWNVVRGNTPDAAILRSDLLRLLDYFNGAQGCVEAELCDLSLLRTLLRDEPAAIFNDYGRAMEALARDGGADSLLAGIRIFAAPQPVDDPELDTKQQIQID